MPWPLVTLLKMHYICSHKEGGYDGYFYFNANTIFLKMTDYLVNLLNENLENGKFICSSHSHKPWEGLCDDIEQYKQAGFFGGNEGIFYEVCEKVVELINDNLLVNKIPVWHDETALNEILKKFDGLLCYRPFMVAEKRMDTINKYHEILKTLFVVLTNGKYKKKKLMH